MKWFQFEGLPKEFFHVSPQNIETWLEGPTVFKIRGRDQKLPPLLISTLLHGNETTGFFALQKFLKYYWDNEIALPRNLILFIGNPRASAKSSRHLSTQPDYNRIWCEKAQKMDPTEETIMAQEMMKYFIEEKPYACVDIHNNTGKNPFYCVVSKLDASFKKLAYFFGESIILITEPKGAFSVAMSDYCPALALECGRSGEDSGIQKVHEYLKALIEIKDLQQLEVEEQTVYRSIARIKIRKDTVIDFNGVHDPEVHYSFIKEIEDFNFHHVKPGTVLGYAHNPDIVPMVLNNENEEVGPEFFENKDHQLRFTKEIIPSMLSRNIQVVLDDCLGYLMEKVENP